MIGKNSAAAAGKGKGRKTAPTEARCVFELFPIAITMLIKISGGDHFLYSCDLNVQFWDDVVRRNLMLYHFWSQNINSLERNEIIWAEFCIEVYEPFM